MTTRIERWRANPDGPTAALGLRVLGGEWTTSVDAEQMGISGSNLSQIIGAIRDEGYKVEVKSAGGNARAYRVAKVTKARKNGSRPIKRETAGVTHPSLGDRLTVRGLFLVDGELVLQLVGEQGGAWQAIISGHVES